MLFNFVQRTMGVFLHPLLHSCIDRINVTLSEWRGSGEG